MNSTGNQSKSARYRLAGGLLGMAAFAAGACLVSPAAWADDASQPVSAARLSSVDGQVQLSQGGQALADQAVVNTPLFEGTRVVTGDDGRAEIQLEDGSVARISPNSSLTLTVLRGQNGVSDAEITLDSGLGYFELQGGQSGGSANGQAGTIRIRFGDSVVTASGFSVFRINLDNPPGELAVFSGNAHLEWGNAIAVDLHGGESVVLNGADAARYDLTESIEPDSWDTWNSDRDQMLNAEAASKTGATNGFADSSNPAWNDLDANGNWYNVPGQGYVWSPYDAANTGWDPYGNGNWMWGPQSGYFWVSSYPWGYLPYQCGNWNFYDGFGWGWAPGLAGCAPWWGGAYFGPNIGIGFGGYRPPIPPRRPHPYPPGGRGGKVGPYPLLAVNRRPAIVNGGLPARDKAAPAVIAGQTVQPIRPLAPRPQYQRTATDSGAVNRPAYSGMGMAGGPAGAVSQNPGGSRTGNFVQSPGARPAAPSAGGQHVPAARPSYFSGGSVASHPASEGSGGGSAGGGGAVHAGGGGGGGGSHR
jgi:hypothetical protein